MTLGWAILAILVVCIVACLVIGFNAIAELLGVMLDACDSD